MLKKVYIYHLLIIKSGKFSKFCLFYNQQSPASAGDNAGKVHFKLQVQSYGHGKFCSSNNYIGFEGLERILKTFPGPVRGVSGHPAEATLKTDELQSIRKEDDKKRQSRHFTTHSTSVFQGENNRQKLVLLKLGFLLPLPASEIQSPDCLQTQGFDFLCFFRLI